MSVPHAYGLAALSGVLYFLAFAGFDLWPLAFVALFPLLHVAQHGQLTPRHTLGVGVLFGFVTNWGGYYWLVGMLETFSGFPWIACVFFASVVCAYQGGQLALFFWLVRTSAQRKQNILWTAAPLYAATERLYPLLFPSYYANCFHDLPWMIQVVDLGGPTLLSMLAVGWNSALLHGLYVARRQSKPELRLLAAGVATLLLTLGYGAFRVQDNDARTANAPQRTIGIVQADMGTFQKRSDPEEGHRRHMEQSAALEREVRPDLLIWPESAVVWPIPFTAKRVTSLLQPLQTPVLFGGIAKRMQQRKRRIYNTAFLTDAKHNIIGTYDKTYLLAFGEYLPFGDRFEWLYDLSPNTGHFTPGTHQRALVLDDVRISTLICYEDVLPSFTRDAVRQNDPHVLVNITNDSWFGDTHEPWIHLALAKFRAVEHHRYLARATNSGVSAIIDASGRVVAHSKTFVRENLHAKVALLTGSTLYGVLGDWPGWLSVVLTLSWLWPRSLSTSRDRSSKAATT